MATPEVWATGEVPDEDYEQPDEAAAAAPPPGQTNIFDGAKRDNIFKRLFGRLHHDKVYLFNYSTHKAMVAVAMCDKQALQSEGTLKAALKADMQGAEVSGERSGKWEYEKFETSYYPLDAHDPPGSQQGVELAIQLQKGCDRAYVTIYSAENPTKVWVQQGVLRGQEWGCIYRHPVDAILPA